MGSPNGQRVQPYFLMPIGWRNLPGVAGLGSSARDLLLRIIEHCHLRQTPGTLAGTEMLALTRDVHHGSANLAKLLDEGAVFVSRECLHVDLHVDSERGQQGASRPPADGEQVAGKSPVSRQQSHVNETHNGRSCADFVIELAAVRRSSRTQAACPCSLVTVQFTLTDPDRWHLGRYASNSIKDIDEDRDSLARARTLLLKKEREKESGRVPRRAAPGAPRGTRPGDDVLVADHSRSIQPQKTVQDPFAEGVDSAEPTGSVDIPAGVTIGKLEALALMRKTIDNSSMSTGKQTPLRRYPMELHSVGPPSSPVKLSREYR